MSFPRMTITKDDFERHTAGAYVVHIAGKGNMPKDLRGEDAMDMTEYTTYNKNYRWYGSFKKQAAVYHDLDANVTAAFNHLLMKISAILEGRQKRGEVSERERVVFTFDGDNYQENSPFTKGIRMLILEGHTVYAFKDKPPKQTHVDSWITTANAPYTALVNLKGTSPKDYTRTRCDAYVSYGYPLLVSIYQPQKDEEILEDGSDVWRRDRPEGYDLPGLVRSSLSSELTDAFVKEFQMDYTPHSQRYRMLYSRKRGCAVCAR